MRYILLVGAALLAGALTAVFASCTVGRLLIGISGGEQHYLVDRLTFLVNKSAHASSELVWKVYGDYRGEAEKPVPPEGVLVSADPKTGLFNCTYDGYALDEHTTVTGTYLLKEHDNSLFHGIDLRVRADSADPLHVNIEMMVFYEVAAKIRYQISTCTVDGADFPTEALTGSRFGFLPRPRTKDGSSKSLLPDL
ncbi:MAG: hypothetical protein ACQEQU_08805 [Spirochaetota bacterium]